MNIRTLAKSILSLCFLLVAVALADAAPEAVPAATDAIKSAVNPNIFWTIAIVMGTGSLAAAYAVGKVGAAAMGASAEKPELLGKAIAFVGMGEGLALFAFLVALFLVFKI